MPTQCTQILFYTYFICLYTYICIIVSYQYGYFSTNCRVMILSQIEEVHKPVVYKHFVHIKRDCRNINVGLQVGGLVCTGGLSLFRRRTNICSRAKSKARKQLIIRYIRTVNIQGTIGVQTMVGIAFLSRDWCRRLSRTRFQMVVLPWA